ncbi:uncharacterized protein LOC115010536 isoform X4 [Cottoperca gobio]|uniref:Uncharacterized protein LOC115010536 isoform X4 n=1 Tax=Cottoperca gobio TaxID=56716 RepID=A0A6J2Q008_COTGO|nr:uncharacterized protein LOC115010536 isoform X4 [Cottoperca gobio]XP_029291010.1 uncharacterized protein LOC115010536 isoform X4 [Cottoperca gobio]
MCALLIFPTRHRDPSAALLDLSEATNYGEPSGTVHRVKMSGTVDLSVKKRRLLIEILSEDISQKLLRVSQVANGLLCKSRALPLDDGHT